jgi:hypothetical protein
MKKIISDPNIKALKLKTGARLIADELNEGCHSKNSNTNSIRGSRNFNSENVNSYLNSNLIDGNSQ